MTDYIDAMGLHKSFGDILAVSNVSLRVPSGQVLGFLGPNGAGKTTTMRMITGFISPDAGEVSICGEVMSLNPIAAKTHIGYLPEGAPLYPDMTALQLLHFCGNARSLAHNFMQERLEFVISTLHLEPVLQQPIETLSKGFKRRVGLAQALLHDPNVLVLDEPTDGLDPLQKEEVRRLIRTIAKNKAIIISTHILEEVEAVCDRAVMIARGRIVADGTPQEIIKKSPHNSFESAFFALMEEANDAA